MTSDVSLEQGALLTTGADYWSTHPSPKLGFRRIRVSDGPRCPVSADEAEELLAGVTQIGVG